MNEKIKRVKIYSKNGTPIEVLASVVSSFLQKGYTKEPINTKNKNKKEVK